MIKVAGMWELGWNTPIKEMDLWQYPLQEFGVDELIMAPISGIKAKVIEVATIKDAITDNPGLTPVFCHELGDVEIKDFAHPENALYIFGRANYSPFNNIAGGDLSIRIATKLNKGMLWPHQAASIILYDRFKKQDDSWQ